MRFMDEELWFQRLLGGESSQAPMLPVQHVKEAGDSMKINPLLPPPWPLELKDFVAASLKTKEKIMQHLTHSLLQRPGQVDESNTFLDSDCLSSCGFDGSMTCVNGGPFYDELQICVPGSRNFLEDEVLPFFGNNVSFFHHLCL
jgi:hypothetical protein